MQSDEISGTWAEWTQDWALRSAIRVARQLTYDRRIPFFGRMARTIAGPMTPFQKRILDNLDYIWPDKDESQRSEIARQSADNFGRALIEHYSMPELSRRMSGVAPIGKGAEVLQDAQANGKPVILMTGHYGNYEAAWFSLIDAGHTPGGLYRPMKNPYINRHYVDSVESLGSGPIFPQGRAGLGQLLRHLKGGNAAIILNDLYVGNGVAMDFLGKPAMTSLSAAELALKLGALVIPYYGIRQPDGLNFKVEIEHPIPTGTAEEMTAAFNRSLEARIISDPGQWFWMHRRWKRKWNRGKGMEPGLHPAALPRKRSG